MKVLQTLAISVALSGPVCASAQTAGDGDATLYKAELFGSAATGDVAPFWITSNQYGRVPVDARNGYLDAGVFHHQHFGKDFRWGAALELTAAFPRYRNVYIHQMYAELGYKSLLLTVGSKENRHSLWNHTLGSGDLVFSSNARPIPEINLSMPAFTTVPFTRGWMQVKGDMAVGRSFDSDYLYDFAGAGQTYVKNILWHHKSFYIRVRDSRDVFPFSGTVGVQHWVQWGGTSSDPRIGVQPHSFKDFLRVFCGKEGGSDATLSDQINVLGNHFGSYDFQLAYERKGWYAAAYHQHYFEDKSGMIFGNGTDGLWGVEVGIPRFSFLREAVTEYVTTRNQSGPFHFIGFDHDKYKGPGGGADNYYNNSEYRTGASYFGHGLGSPLLTSPAYNTDGNVSFRNTRIRAWHLAFEGDLSPGLSYRVKYTLMNGWGVPYEPFRAKLHSHSVSLALRYRHSRLPGWEFTGIIAGDGGTLYGDSAGVGLRVTKCGCLKLWK